MPCYHSDTFGLRLRQETSAIDVELDDGTSDEPYLAWLSHSRDMVLAGHPTISEAR